MIFINNYTVNIFNYIYQKMTKNNVYNFQPITRKNLNFTINIRLHGPYTYTKNKQYNNSSPILTILYLKSLYNNK